jgi:glucosamine--fructose-6-phosphate aminotransferase (isomerizing)
MCGIVGYLGRKQAAPILVEGLKRLEYRGYDSFGIATLNTDIRTLKKCGRISENEGFAANLPGIMGIGHTRWATHGVPDDRNAHPHADCSGTIAVVHNGIIENYAELKRLLIDRGHTFTSETDTEVIAHLIEEHFRGDLLDAVRKTLTSLKGSYAILAVAKNDPRIIAARLNSPLVLGVGDDELFASSDMTPLLEHTQRIIYLEEGDIASIGPGGIRIFNGDALVEREENLIEWDMGCAKKGGFDHYMLKEIFEQPDVFFNTLTSVEDEGLVSAMKGCSGITVVSCGTSYHAGMIFRYLIEQFCHVPVRVELASEYKYFTPPASDVAIAVTQSGETADTIAALKKAGQHNCHTIAITNMLGSTVTRIAERTLYMRAGPEISVAATKSFIAQLAVFFQIINLLSESRFDKELLTARQAIEEVLLLDVDEAVGICRGAEHLFFVGRGPFYPVALEGALKMKEISYIHAEGYAAGELKHGPFALLSEESPVIALCTPNDCYGAMLSNIKEMKARGAPIIGIGHEGDRELEEVVDVMIPIPPSTIWGEILATSVVLQILAYRTAKALGKDVDKPRNLAKSVTVE